MSNNDEALADCTLTVMSFNSFMLSTCTYIADSHHGLHQAAIDIGKSNCSESTFVTESAFTAP